MSRARPRPDSALSATYTTMTEDESAELVRRVQSGHAESFTTLIEAHRGRAWAIALRILDHREDAEDLIQDAMLAAFSEIGRCDPVRPFAPWFYRIVVNRGLNARRSRRLRTMEPLDDKLQNRCEPADRVLERSELGATVREAIERLPERQRTIIRMIDLEERTTGEVSRELRLSEGAVRWHVHRARTLVREQLSGIAA
jgi:RNA polymerase sigma-70 factor, ECF subfamily